MDIIKGKGDYIITGPQWVIALLTAVAINSIFLISKVLQDNWSLFLAYTINFLSIFLIILDQLKFRESKLFNYIKISFLNYTFPFAGTCYILYKQESFLMYSYFLIGFFILLEFINHRFKELFIVIAAFAGLVAMTLALENLVVSLQTRNFYLVIIFFLFAVSYHHYKFKKSAYSQMERLKILGGSIAHELRTHIATIILGTDSLKKTISKVLEPYKENKIEENFSIILDSSQVEMLQKVPLSLHKTAREAALLIDMLLTKIKSDNCGIVYTQICDSSEIVKEVLRIYPFSKAEKDTVKFDSEHNFTFRSSPEAVRHIFFNLFRNALYQMQKYSRGKIQIWFQYGKEYNEIHFKDTTIGISDEKLPTLFSEVQVSTSNGTGLGLPFCKIVMQNSNGNIICRSVLGEYTEFILQFPVVKQL